VVLKQFQLVYMCSTYDEVDQSVWGVKRVILLWYRAQSCLHLLMEHWLRSSLKIMKMNRK